ncbi:response regulator [Paenibacillus chungangensis]|uniref:Response regulator n=1 Tax=Paenibacillus chungangensis TaxID=696535 RepID=A0ABW3HU33_9BACL
MRLMIVEDEVRLRNNLLHNIEWESYGIDVIPTANGVEAVREMERQKPDIVLMDIRMPKMDGLSLAKIIRDNYPSAKMIILSGHDDFAYAQQAVELGVMKYLLKPAGNDEIVHCVLEAKSAIKQELQNSHNHEALEKKWLQNLPGLREEFLYNMVAGRYSAWEIDKKSQDLMLHLHRIRQICVVAVEMDPLSENETRFSDDDQTLLRFSLKCIAAEYLEREQCEVIADPFGNTVLIFIDDSEREEAHFANKVNICTAKLLSVVKEVLKLTASAGIGSCVKAEDAAVSYRQAERALGDRMIFGYHIAIPYREEREQDKLLHFQPDAHFEKKLEVALLTGETDTANRLLQDCAGLQLEQCKTIDEVYENLLWLNSMMIRMIQAQGWSVKEVVGSDYECFINIQNILTKDQAIEWMRRTVGNITGYAVQSRQSNTHMLIKQILKLVEENLDLELTLHSVADQLYVNSSYLSRLFKKETGKAFSTYVLERKMNCAKEYLINGDKVYDAAAKAGYRDVSYFIRVFRKYWGITPGEVNA